MVYLTGRSIDYKIVRLYLAPNEVRFKVTANGRGCSRKAEKLLAALAGHGQSNQVFVWTARLKPHCFPRTSSLFPI